jgi:type IV fimbrial biogenesis protein FimT
MLTRLKPRRQNGFTLIELMIAVAVLAVIVTLGAPSFQTLIQNTRLRTTAEAILNGLQLARAEAVRRNTNVSFVLGANLGWGVIAGAETLQERSAAEGSSGVQLDVEPDLATTVTFSGMGRVVANDDASASLTRIAISGGSKSRRIDIGSGGIIRICDPEITAADDPRRC